MLAVFTKVKNAYVKVFQVRKACAESFNSPDYVDKFIYVARLNELTLFGF